ncbi:transglycosylase domain-containing protein [Arthrobacter bambusae]|uniref:transglycosylase domain-containing protein n=2 Tax=Arthrobacter bambusae TaxID=1338426 RepID=UPI00277E46C1|nr:transglycosylase domain-containing protein [Arthrobacter bambusae]MDQ0031476.1 membrane peptidoglycan carboxypeptidase [Arthrobacter bambusae]MDQ0099636.1 membrane peptidoglycan carboxypeptidase [Arthrobacter bambusae]
MLMKDTFWGKILAFVAASVVCGVLVAGLWIPASAVGATVAGGSIDLFNQLPANMDVNAPAQASKVLASDGSVIASFYSENRTPVELGQMSPFIRDGIVSIEDARFYQHGGVDATGILRALMVTAQGGRQGASTITQQYVNNMIIESLVAEGKGDQVKLGAAKTVGDKLREMKLAIALEQKYTKEQILAGYLNIVYFGNGAYGIQAAAKEYFNVPASELTLPEAAALAGVVNSPVYYDPLTEPDHVVARRNEVLDKMLQQGHITAAQHDAAVKAPLGLNVHQSAQGCAAAASAPYFCDYVQRLILNDPAFGADETARKNLLYLGGLTIRTTLDAGLEKVAQDQVNASMPAADPLQRGASLVSVQPGTGKILTMAQNTVYDPATAPGNYTGNFALPEKDANGLPLDGAGGFQIGSTMKPFVFAEWLNSGRSMATKLDGSVRVYKAGYPWKNSCGKTTGSYDPALGQTPLPNDDANHYFRMSVLQGLYQSINTITFQSATQLDFCNIQKMATAAGIANGHTNQPYDLSSIASLIGTQDVAPLDMANAYATFAAHGVHCNPVALESVTDAHGHNYPVPSSDCKQAINPDVAAGVTYALKNVLTKGSGYNIPVNKDHDIFAKTGTTDGNTMTWTVGATTGISTASWFGSYKGIGPQWVNQDITINGKYYAGVDGADIAGGQWGRLMDAAAPKYTGNPFPLPPDSMTR